MFGRFHWPARSAGVLLAASATLAVYATAGSAATLPAGAFTNGTAAATAQSMKFNPTAAQLSIGVTFGISLAGYTNEVAKAESRGIDLGVIGTTLAAQGCDGSAPSLAADKQPQPITVDSRDPNAAGGKTGAETFYGYPIPAIQKSAKATSVPFSEATTLTGPVGATGFAEFSGARSDAITRVVNGNVREAIATTDIDAVSLYAGIVKLGSLHWQVIERSGADPTTVFSLGTMEVNGTPVPIPATGPDAAFAAANTVLAAFGLQLRAPAIHTGKNAASIDPMAIAVIPNATRDALLGTVLGAVQPVRKSLTDAILEQSCKNGTYITVADIAIGSISGSGSFSLELGGVSASTGDVVTSHFLGAIPTFNPNDNSALPSTDLSPIVSGTGFASLPPADGGLAPATGATAAPTATTHGARTIAAAKGTRGGRLAALAAGTLLLLAAVAEADRRKMRRAQRMIPAEA